MRRIMFALSLAVAVAIVPFSPPVDAEGASRPVPLPMRPVVHIRPAAGARLARRVADLAIERSLLDDAASMRISVESLRAEWELVAICEVAGNWSMVGSAYSGIGFLNSTWEQYGGTTFAPRAGQASADQQILIGMKVTNGRVPDQNGCSSNGW